MLTLFGLAFGLATFPEGSARLVKAFIYSRHGARSPFHNFPNDNVHWYCDEITADTVAYASKGEYQDVGQGFLHVYDQSNVLPGTCYQGQLTSVGLAEHYLLGMRLRYKYIHELRFVPEEFDPALVRLRSTDVARTRQSLASQIRGWFRDSLYTQHIHPVINIQEKSTDPLADQDWCTAFTTTKKRIQADNLDLISMYSDRLHELQEMLGYKGDADDDEYDLWYNLWDNFITRTWLGMSYPRGVTYADMVTGNNIADIFTSLIYCNADYNLSLFMKRARIGPYITELLDLIDKEEGPGSEKLHITACHDTTIMPLMATFAGNSWDCNWPPYAAYIELQIWEHEGDRYVRLYYMGRHVLPVGCTDSRICLLSDFLEKLHEVAVPYEDWNALCT